MQSEGRGLQENLSRWAISAASARKDRDQVIAGWAENLHSALKLVGTSEMIPMVHKVIDNMEEFLRRSKHDGVW